MYRPFLILVSAALAVAQGPTPSTAAPGPQLKPITTMQSEALFQRIKSLAGFWENKSTKGWTEHGSVRVLGKGSAVLFLGSFDDTPEEAMAEVYYLDQGRLLLTHYCEARNQPTLVASAISEDGNTIEFTFLHGTGMASRDTGHMDKMVLQLSGTDNYASQWTWYAKGKENWMERIESRRAPDKASSSSAGQTP